MPQRPVNSAIKTKAGPPPLPERSVRALSERRIQGVLLPKPPRRTPGRSLPLVLVWLVACLVVGSLAGLSLPTFLTNPSIGVVASNPSPSPVVAARLASLPSSPPPPTAELLTLPPLSTPTLVPPLPTVTLDRPIPTRIAPVDKLAPTVTVNTTPTVAPTITPIAAPTATAEPATPSPTPRPANLEAAIQTSIDKWKSSLGSTADFGLVIHNLDTDEKVAINPQKLYVTASVYKLFVMLTVYEDISQGHLSLDDSITLTPQAADPDDDGGVLIVGVGESMSVRDLLYAMITASNNTAALMLMFQVRVGHMQQVVADLGFKETDLSDSYNFRTTPEDLDQLFSRLANQKLLGPKYDAPMLDLLSHQQVRDRIPALLPANTRVANKTGNLSDVTNDTGLVFLPNGKRLSITVLVSGADGQAARRFISQLSLAAYNYYTP